MHKVCTKPTSDCTLHLISRRFSVSVPASSPVFATRLHHRHTSVFCRPGSRPDSRLSRPVATTAGIPKRHLQIQTAAMSSSSTSTPQPAALSAEERAALVEKSKRAAAYQAVRDYLQPTFRHVGIGSGSTVVYVVEAIAAQGPSVTAPMLFYPTGEQSRRLILAAGLRLAYVQDLPAGTALDVAFDGADEVDEHLNLIKGGGACLTQEKIVASSARRFVCVADFRKRSARLGTAWRQGVPIEVLPMAADRVLAELRHLGSATARVRPGLPGKAGPIVTDNGMLIIDAPFPPLLLPGDEGVAASGKEGDGADGIWTVDALAQRLINIVGVAEIGLFHGKNGDEVAMGAQKPVAAYFGMEDGTVEVLKAKASA
ncbi:hypothetical protein VTK73DRAFT_7210 [Phialemonium thermophilum]|uniref:Ribose-5-phosphate isomerase n=1 Tax=Phialemonium thermophilum TaxID=223376 RepID=A0ABR3WFT4_9PEZI